MDRVAVFVDAGYLFAQGATALTGTKKERHFTRLNSEKLLRALRSVVNERSGHGDLLRVYWYGAIPHRSPAQVRRELMPRPDAA